MGDRVWTLLTETYAELQLKVLYYHDGMSAEVKATLKDVNKHWPEYDHVMFTSSILNGIDCYVENHFHCGMVFGSAGHGPNARDLFQMAHRVRRFVDEEMYFCMQQCNQGTARCLTTLESIKNNSPALLQLQADLRNGVSRFVEPPPWLKQVHYHNIWENNLSGAYLDRSFTYWCEQGGYRVIDHQPKKPDANTAHVTKQLLDIQPKSVGNIPGYESIMVLPSEAVEPTQRAVWGMNPTLDQYWQLYRFMFDAMIQSSSVPIDTVAEIFKAVQTSNDYKWRFNNVYLLPRSEEWLSRMESGLMPYKRCAPSWDWQAPVTILWMCREAALMHNRRPCNSRLTFCSNWTTKNPSELTGRRTQMPKTSQLQL